MYLCVISLTHSYDTLSIKVEKSIILKYEQVDAMDWVLHNLSILKYSILYIVVHVIIRVYDVLTE